MLGSAVGFVGPQLDTWFHLAVVFDGTDVHAYYDGASQGIVSGSNPMQTPMDTDKNWLIGKVNHFDFGALPVGSGRVKFFDGLIDEVQIHDRAFVEEEIDILINHGIIKTITSGPDEDGNSEIDLVIEVGKTDTTPYDFTITYHNPGGPSVLILDTLPAEWIATEVDSIEVDVDECGESDSVGNVDIFKNGKSGKNCRSATQIEWTPENDGGSLRIDAETRESPGKGHTKRGGAQAFAPTSCGALYLNDGAQVYETFNDEVIPFEEPLFTSNKLCLVAVKDLNGEGIVYDGTGDEDGDGFSTTLKEACEYGRRSLCR